MKYINLWLPLMGKRAEEITELYGKEKLVIHPTDIRLVKQLYYYSVFESQNLNTKSYRLDYNKKFGKVYDNMLIKIGQREISPELMPEYLQKFYTSKLSEMPAASTNGKLYYPAEEVFTMLAFASKYYHILIFRKHYKDIHQVYKDLERMIFFVMRNKWKLKHTEDLVYEVKEGRILKQWNPDFPFLKR